MKYIYVFISGISLLAVNAQCSSAPTNSIDPTEEIFDMELDALQQSIDVVIAQSNMDPIIAQQLTDKINQLNQHFQANMQKDEKDIKVAAALNSFLETVSTLMQSNATFANFQGLFNSLTYAARINTLQKLVCSAYFGNLKKLPYYIDPYTETIGFTLNNLVINGILQNLLTGVKAPIPGTTLTLDITSPVQNWLLQATAGVIATVTWYLQKKLALSSAQQ